MKPGKWIGIFVYSAGGLLLAAALIRFITATGNAQVLALPDPVGIPLRYAVLIAGIIELTVASICLFGRQVQMQIVWLAWLATSVVLFWVDSLVTHYQIQGTCLDSLTDPLLLAHGITGYIVELTPFYLVLGSYAAGLWLWFSKEGRSANLAAVQQLAAQRDAAAGLMKMFCPACGGHVKFAAQNIGQQIPCPHCKTIITLCKPEEKLKMTCVLCGGNIEFPAHALGQKIQCPHCAKNITLLKPA
jgi:DNA-directed RNA polymerase subunit RPC12/RpoP